MFKGFDKVNLGSGSMSLKGFLNVDWPQGHLDGIAPEDRGGGVVYKTPDVYMDIRNMKQIPNESFSYVRASHVLEHFCISETRSILKEWTRILKPKGTIDIIVPDFDDIVKERYYNNKDGKYDEWWKETMNDKGLWWDTPEKEPLKSKEMALIQLLYLNGHHKAFFNFEFLKSLLEENRINNIKRYENTTPDTALCIYSLCVKGEK